MGFEESYISADRLSRLDPAKLREMSKYLADLADLAEMPDSTEGLSKWLPAAQQRSSQELDRHVRRTRPPLPDPKLVRRIIRQRQLRSRHFDSDLFADPAWDMLLDLAAARAEHVRVSITSVCIASAVPPTTALRWIKQLTDAGLLQRTEDENDARRGFISLTPAASDAMAAYFQEIGKLGSCPI